MTKVNPQGTGSRRTGLNLQPGVKSELLAAGLPARRGGGDSTLARARDSFIIKDLWRPRLP